MAVNRVLVVDDNGAVADFVGEAAKRAGYEARCLTDATRFMETFAEFQPTLLVIDLSMPRMDGIELMRDLANLACEAGILLFSGQEPRLLESAARLGMARGLKMLGTIQKPVRLAPLCELLRQIRYEESTAPQAKADQHATKSRAAGEGAQ